jgi:hypothetical protein
LVLPAVRRNDHQKSLDTPAMRLKIGLNGDRRLTEKVIVEIQAAARSLGVEIASVQVVRDPVARRKARKSVSRRKARTSA